MWNEPSLEVLKRLPRLRANENTPLEKIVIRAHFFVGSCDWYAAEFDGEDTFWGFVNLGDPQNAEWGYFSLSELREVSVRTPMVNGPTGECLGQVPIEVEWDEYWRPKPFAEIGWGR